MPIAVNGPWNPSATNSTQTTRMVTGIPAISQGWDRAVTIPRASVERNFGIGEPPGVRGARMPSSSPRRGGPASFAGAR